MKEADVRAFRRLARRFARVTGGLQGDGVCCAGVSVPQAHALLQIEDSPGTSLIELSAALGLDKSTMSRTVDALVRGGFVERARDVTDRRLIRLTLTSDGELTCDAINRLGNSVVGRTFELIPRDKHGEIVECLRLLVEASEAADEECGTEDATTAGGSASLTQTRNSHATGEGERQ